MSLGNYPVWSGFGRGKRGLFISFVLGQQVVFETLRTPVVTELTSTVNANYFVFLERTIWQIF